ncbi:MAG: nucleotide exchange factor GrpE [Prevotella sp.]|nr:nucleotide exchange factor GrpE [Prevotella sp.]MBQ2534724.1 nucleotide exchange factor GrpE [Prevotella sp.]
MNTVDNEKTENVDVEVNDTNEVEASENQEPKDEQQQETAENAETAETEQQDPLEAAKAEIEELKKQALYKQAEFENFRKRTLKEKADLILAGGEKAITAILPVLDDFERALADKSDDANAIREGMELIFQKFQKTLESLGVKKIETDGVDFNVDYHESVALVPGMGEDKKGKVIDCVQTGYTLNDKVIRFAKVAVGQ